MSKVLDLTGTRVGRLVALHKTKINKQGSWMWLCKCDCGNEKEIVGSQLNRKYRKTNSCGCLNKEINRNTKRKEKGSSGFNSLKWTYIKRAEYKGFNYSLTDEELVILFKANCYYCGGSPKMNINRGGNKIGKEYSNYLYNGIDKVNPKLGYINTNVVSCCKQCNIMKLDYSVDEFINQCKIISERFK